MNEHYLEALDPELQLLVAAERRRPIMPAEVKQRLRSRLGSDISGAGSGGAGGASPATVPPAAEPALPGTRGLTSQPTRLAAVTFVLGCVVGAGLHAWLSPPRPLVPPSRPAEKISSISPVPFAIKQPSTAAPPFAPPLSPVLEAPAPRQVSAAALSTSVAAGPRAPSRPRPHAATQPAPLPAAPQTEVAVPRSRDADLALERALIEIARTAVTRSRAPEAIEALRRHEQQFPHGRLVEERESLLVQALVLLGRGSEARTQAEKFHQHFPESLLQPVVDAAIKTIQ